jgi:hypothetical protein
VAAPPPAPAATKTATFDKGAYQREYMRKRRAAQKEGKPMGDASVKIEITPEMIDAASYELASHDMTGEFDRRAVAREVLIAALEHVRLRDYPKKTL